MKNIEKTILSSIIFAGSDGDLKQVQQIKKYIDLLQVDDFVSPCHRLIFAAIRQLEHTNVPVHEDFIVRITKDEQGLMDVLTANPVSNIEPYSIALKQDTAKRELQKALDKSLESGELDVEKIQAQLNRLQDSAGQKQNQKIDEKFIDFFDSYNLNQEYLENLKTDYLYDNFIVKNEVTMFAAKPSSGKSLTTLALVNMALEANKVEYVFYFDLDNSLTTLKERNIGSLRQKWGKRLIYIHPSFVEKPIIWRMIKELQKRDLSESLVVFDSAKNFMIGGDRDKNKDVSKVTEIFKSLRNKGATVLFLHHTNKPQQAINELTYAGSSAWEEDSSNAFILTKNEHKKTFIFIPIKNRVGELNTMAFQYQNDHILIPVDALEASETEEIEQINSEIIDFIEAQTQKPTYSLIMQHLQKLGYPRNKSNEALQNGKNRYWQEQKITQNNKSVFTIIEKPVVVEFQTIYQQNQEISLNKSDKSDKSYLRASFASDHPRISADKCQINKTSIAHSLTSPPTVAMPVI